MHRTAVLSVCIALASLGSIASAQTPTRVTLEAMNLEVELPPGWIVDPNPGMWALGGDALRPAGAEVYWPTVEVMSGFETCAATIERYGKPSEREPRISLIPETYHPTVAYTQKSAGVHYVHTCIGAGRETVHVRLRFMPGEDHSAVTTLLETIARAYTSRVEATRPIASTPQASSGSERTLHATGLVVTVPAGWRATKEMAGKQPADMLSGGMEHIIVSRFPQNTCAQMIENFEGQHKTTASPRPAFAPASFHSSAVVSRARGGISYTFCRSTGARGIYAIIAGAAMTENVTPELVGTLHSLARAIDQVAPAATPEVTSAPRTQLSGTGLSVALPTGWLAFRQQKGSVYGDMIVGPRETVIVARSTQLPSCSKLLQHYAGSANGTLQGLASFAPPGVHPEMVVSTNAKGQDVYSMCIMKAPGLYGLEAHVPPGASPSAELTSLLHSVVAAINPYRSGDSSVARGSASYDSTWRSTRDASEIGNTMAFEVHGTMLSPPSGTMMSTSYGIAGGLNRLNLGTPDDGFKLATEFVAVGGYSANSGVTADLRAGVGASLSAGSKSRIGFVVGLGADGIGIGQDEGDPAKLVLPFGTLLYATAAVRTSVGDSMALQVAGSYRARSNEAEYLGEARLYMTGRRAWSILAYYKDIELASIIGGGIAFGL